MADGIGQVIETGAVPMKADDGRRHLHPDRTANLNDVDPLAWLVDVLARLQDQPAKRIDQLLPGTGKPFGKLRAGRQ